MATTTNYSWTTPDNTAYVKDGASAIRTLGSSVDTTLFTALGGTYPGLRLIKKQTVGTGVTSVNVTGAFSATYENYRIVLSGIAGTVSNAPLTLAMGGSTGATFKSTSGYMTYGSTSFNGYNASGQTNFKIGWTDTSSGVINVSLDLISPFLTKQTTFTSAGANNSINYTSGGFDTASLSSTAFTIAGDTFTGGVIYVYGYGAS
jgi:hypothetical protein